MWETNQQHGQGSRQAAAAAAGRQVATKGEGEESRGLTDGQAAVILVEGDEIEVCGGHFGNRSHERNRKLSLGEADRGCDRGCGATQDQDQDQDRV